MPEQAYPTDPDRFFAQEVPAGKKQPRTTIQEQNHLSPADLLAQSRATVKVTEKKQRPFLHGD